MSFWHLKQLGIDVWQSRSQGLLFDPSLLDFKVQVTPPVIYPRCLAVLTMASMPMEEDAKKEVDRIFKGMLGVLKLPSQQLAVARVYGDVGKSAADVLEQLKKYCARFILIFDQDFTEIVNAVDAKTFHPMHLYQHPEDKRQAYQDLLTVQKRLAN